MALRFPLPSATYQQAIGKRSEFRPILGRHRLTQAFDGQVVGASKTKFAEDASLAPASPRKMISKMQPNFGIWEEGLADGE